MRSDFCLWGKTNMFRSWNRGLIGSYISHALLVDIAWVRLLLFMFLLGVFFGIRDRFPGWQLLVWLTMAFGVYNAVVALLLKSRRDHIARWVGGSFDTLTIMMAIFLLATSGSTGEVSHNLMSIGILLAIPLSMVQFGLFVGILVAVGLGGWYLFMYSLAIGFPMGSGMILIQVPALLVISGLVVSLSRNIRNDQHRGEQPCNKMLPVLHAGRNSLERGHEYEADVPANPLGRPLPGTKKVRLYIAEEQYILRKAYESFFPIETGIEVIGVSGKSTGEDLIGAALGLEPNVMLLGFKTLQPEAVEKLEMIRECCPSVALVVLSAYYDVRGIKALRDFSRGSSTACAFLLKHTVDTVEQLVHVIHSVAEGRVILDPTVMEGLIADPESEASLLHELSPAELSVLRWMAKGYRDDTIAHVLHIEPKKLQRHINSIYRKLGDCPESMDIRMHAITLYLKATGIAPL